MLGGVGLICWRMVSEVSVVKFEVALVAGCLWGGVWRGVLLHLALVWISCYMMVWWLNTMRIAFGVECEYVFCV